MARFDVYNGAGKSDFLLDVQSDFHSHLRTRVVIPLRLAKQVKAPAKGLHVAITVNGESCYLVTPMLAAVSIQHLGKPVANIQEQSSMITAAIDFLLQGF